MAVNVAHVKMRYNIQTVSDLTAAGETTSTTLIMDTGHQFIQTSTGRILLVSDWRDPEGIYPVITGFTRDVTQMYTNKFYQTGMQSPHTPAHLANLKDTVKKSGARLTGLTGPQATLLASINTLLG